MTKFRFSCVGSRDLFVKDLAKDKFKLLSDTEVEVTADYCAPCCPEPEEKEMCSREMVCNMMSSVYSYLDYIQRQNQAELGYLYQLWNQHQTGHLPPINSAEQMKRVLAKIGMDDEYTVAEKYVYASDGRASSVLVDFDGYKK